MEKLAVEIVIKYVYTHNKLAVSTIGYSINNYNPTLNLIRHTTPISEVNSFDKQKTVIVAKLASNTTFLELLLILKTQTS